MKYDFDRVIERRNTDSSKWDTVKALFGREDVLPMWVADMDFPTAEPIVEALRKRADHPFYGYTQPGPGVFEAVVERMQRKYNWTIQPEWVVFTPGVVPALNMAVRALARPGDEIIIQEPVYYPFFPAVTGAGCQIVNNGLQLKGEQYEMDLEDLENQFRPRVGMTPLPRRIKALILCNPHNPVGRLWNRKELEGLGEIALRQGIPVISDEIHCEILFQGQHHTPFAALSKEFEQNCIVCLAPSKTFGLAGLEVSSLIIPNKKLRQSFAVTRAGILPGPNIFGYAALEAAYRHGDEWLDQMLAYLQGNLDFLLNYLKEDIPRIKTVRPQGTYLVWLDCRDLGLDDPGLRDFMRTKARVGLDDGFLFGKAGSGFQRMNIACPRSILEEGLERIKKAVEDL
ncbi:MAG: MalY/PatB family protein [Thermodesulfobacteriota bacterium]